MKIENFKEKYRMLNEIIEKANALKLNNEIIFPLKEKSEVA